MDSRQGVFLQLGVLGEELTAGHRKNFKIVQDGTETLGSGDSLWNDHVKYETKFSATSHEGSWSFRMPVRQSISRALLYRYLS